MKIKSGFELVNIAGDYMLIPIGEEVDDFNGTLVLNEVAAFLLDKLKSDIEREDLVQLLINEYDVDRITAQSVVDKMLNELIKMGVVYERKN